MSPVPCADMTLLQAVAQPLLPWVDARSWVGLGMGCSRSGAGVLHPVAAKGLGRQGDGEVVCARGAIRVAPCLSQ